ncbi:hypothetical protein [Bacillus phage FI_KG-Lek]|nr:hypothetical protein [Bacillus phage FI_KG-Lek]
MYNRLVRSNKVFSLIRSYDIQKVVSVSKINNLRS